MRDGIYKDLPLPQSWRRCLRACERPAERGETTRRLVELALQQDASREIPPAVVRQLNRLLEQSNETLPGFATPLSRITANDFGASCSPLAQSVFLHAQRLEREGLRGGQLADQSLSNAFREWKERQLRHIEQHCLIKAGTQAGPLLRAVRDAIASADTDAVAQRVRSGNSERAPRARPPIQIDEDLTRPK